MARARLTLEIDLNSGDYTVDIKNLDQTGAGIPLATLREVFDDALSNIREQHVARANPAQPIPQAMEIEDSVTAGNISRVGG